MNHHKIPLVNPIPVTGAGGQTIDLTHLYVAYRQWRQSGDLDWRNSFYRTIPLASGGSYPIPNSDGVLVHAASCTSGTCIPYLLAANPITDAAYVPNFSADTYLRPSDGWFDVPGNTIRVQVQQVSPSGGNPNAVVEIEY